MPGKAANLLVKILVDADEASQGLDSAAGKFGRFESTMAGLAGPAAIVGGSLLAMGGQAVSAASDAQQAMGAVESVFGDAAGQVEQYASTAATNLGLSETAYNNLAAVSGAAFQNMGLDAQDAAASTNDLIGIGADLAATFGGSTADAVEALQAAFRGEADPAERFGLNLKQSAINAQLAEMGLDGLTGSAAAAAQQQAIMALITEQSAGALGQFGRESDTAAGSAQIASAQFENASAQLGSALLPAVTAVTTALAGMATWVQENSTLVLVLGGVIGGLAAAILAINAALIVYRAVQTVATAATWLFNAAWLASPITWIVIGILAIVAGIVLLWQKCEGFRKVVTAVWNAMKTGAIAAWNGIKVAVAAVVNWAKSAIASLGRFVLSVWTSIKAAATTVWNGIRAVVAAVVAAIKAYMNSVRAVVTAVWNGIRTVAATAWNGIRAIVQGVVTSIMSIINGLKSAASSVFNFVKSVATGALNAILAPVRALQAAFNAVVGAVQSLIGWISRIKIPDLGGLFSAVGGLFSAPAPSMAAAGVTGYGMGVGYPSLRRPVAAATAGRSGAGITINVSGTLNDADAARALRRVLRNDSRARAGVVIGGERR